MARFQTYYLDSAHCLFTSNICHLKDSSLSPDEEKEIDIKDLKKIQRIRIYDNEKTEWTNRYFIDNELYEEVDHQNKLYKDEISNYQKILKDYEERLNYSNQQLEYYKSISEI